jgi:hypothetical protein
MSKSNYFSGKSVFGLLISLIDDRLISEEGKKSDSDRYVKRFKTKNHLISMLFCSFAKCKSLIEISGTMLVLTGKIEHFKLNLTPKKTHIV